MTFVIGHWAFIGYWALGIAHWSCTILCPRPWSGDPAYKILQVACPHAAILCTRCPMLSCSPVAAAELFRVCYAGDADSAQHKDPRRFSSLQVGRETGVDCSRLKSRLQ